MIVRQGDLLLRRVATRDPAGEVREHTLAVGEESGHWHAAIGVLEEIEGRRLLTVREPTLLRVEGQPGRHTPIELPPGTWDVWTEREYVPREVPRAVQD